MAYKKPLNPFLEKLGQQIAAARESKGLTREDIIKRAEIGKYYYYRVEYGNANPSIMQLKKIADALGVSVTVFLEFPH
jgi:transcriptional regulator with XRE-family HTH domain